ncbi:response regulator [Devosia sp. YIM 151766]|uniref:response regulator n=1 Tax=Devosia sp. YIM 151766 TaxID=3017325 RepID=UPI00255D0860|nr:response regulator [Devosia sp. YIM 151766]WIY52998.1 response regulator [Devosia sp. YIM 151766]
MTLGPPKGRRAVILVVDDDALITLNMVDQLSDLGHVALEAYSASEALAMLRERGDIDMLVTDFSMPGMNGVELAEAALAHNPGLIVLLTSGYADLPEGIACKFPRLEKPFREDEFHAKIGELLAAPVE